MMVPSTLLGFVFGPVRWESNGGWELYSPDKTISTFVLKKPELTLGRLYAVSPLQKRSRFGFLWQFHEKIWQWCFHFWIAFRFQKPAQEGTERVIYFRAGWSRWDPNLSNYVKWPIGFGTLFLGLHYD